MLNVTETTCVIHMLRLVLSAVAAHSSPFAAASASHVSAAGHYGYQPPAQMDHQMADKENAAMQFSHGMWSSPASTAPGGHGSGIGPVGGCLGVRKRGRDEVLFQEFKRRRLTGMWTDGAPSVGGVVRERQWWMGGLTGGLCCRQGNGEGWVGFRKGGRMDDISAVLAYCKCYPIGILLRYAVFFLITVAFVFITLLVV